VRSLPDGCKVLDGLAAWMAWKLAVTIIPASVTGLLTLSPGPFTAQHRDPMTGTGVTSLDSA